MRSLFVKATTSTMMAVMGAVGPEHCTRVPPNRAVMVAIIPAESMPIKAPSCRPERIPKEAPRLRAMKLTINAAIKFCRYFFMGIFLNNLDNQ